MSTFRETVEEEKIRAASATQTNGELGAGDWSDPADPETWGPTQEVGRDLGRTTALLADTQPIDVVQLAETKPLPVITPEQIEGGL